LKTKNGRRSLPLIFDFQLNQTNGDLSRAADGQISPD
jgi:hypothetical protein